MSSFLWSLICAVSGFSKVVSPLLRSYWYVNGCCLSGVNFSSIFQTRNAEVSRGVAFAVILINSQLCRYFIAVIWYT